MCVSMYARMFTHVHVCVFVSESVHVCLCVMGPSLFICVHVCMCVSVSECTWGMYVCGCV